MLEPDPGAAGVNRQLRKALHKPGAWHVLPRVGAGKSSVIRLLAGVDDQFDGHLHKADGIHVTHLQQEPPLADGPTVDDNIRPALERIQAMLREFEEVPSRPVRASAADRFI